MSEEHGEQCPNCGLDTLVVADTEEGVEMECEVCGYTDFVYDTDFIYDKEQERVDE